MNLLSLCRVALVCLSFGSMMGATYPCQATPASGWKIEPFSSTGKLLASGADSPQLDPFKASPILLDAVRGEFVSFQFVVRAGDKPIQKLEIAPNGMASVLGDFIPSSAQQIFREHYVRVTKPSGNRIRESKWWPDALESLPLKVVPPTAIAAGGSAVFWVTLKIPRDATPTDYFGELDVTADGDLHRLAIALHIRPIELPVSNFRGTVALYYDTLRDWYRKSGREFSDAQWQEQKRRYAEFLLDYGLNPYDPPFAWNDANIDAYLKDPRVHSVRTPPLDSSDFSIAVGALKRSGTFAKAFYYWNDEPQNAEQFTAIRANSTKLRALGIPQLVTAHPNEALSGAVDIWCPNVSNALGTGHLDIPALKREQALGHPTWLYTMVVPTHPYPTWLLDDDSSAILSYAPLWSKVGATGFVYSMAHGWGPKPLDDLTSYQNTSGDGTLLYPAELVGGQGPMPSIHLMLLRDAIEDTGLWQQARAKKIAPAFEFPAERKGPLVYDRTVLLDALESGKAPALKASKSLQLFPEVPTSAAFVSPQKWRLDATRTVEARLEGGVLIVDFHGKTSGENLVHGAVIVEPVNVEKRTERWRLNWNWALPGLEIQKRTSQGSSRVVRVAIHANKTLTGARLWIPLSALGLSPEAVRFNLFWKDQVGEARFSPDGNDPFLAPILKQSVAKVGQQKPKTVAR